MELLSATIVNLVNTGYTNYSHLLYLNKTSTSGHITEIISCLHPRFRPLDRTALLGWSGQQALHPPLSMSLCSIVHSLTVFHIININNLLSLLLCLISSSCSHAHLQYSTLSILTISTLFFFVWYCHPAVMLIIVWRSHTLGTALVITSTVGGPWNRDSWCPLAELSASLLYRRRRAGVTELMWPQAAYFFSISLFGIKSVPIFWHTDSVCRCPSCLYEHQNIISRPEDVFGFFKPGNLLLKYGT